MIVAGKDNEKLMVDYPALKSGTGYAAASIQLEFGGRATGEPRVVHSIACDAAVAIDGVDFPTARPVTMAAERTFWEKATAMHVFCLQGRLRGERYSRHWYDLVAIAKSAHFSPAINDRDLANLVAEHKSMFFAEKDSQGTKIDYVAAVNGGMQLVPTGESRTALERDYAAMLEDGLLALHQPDFEQIMETCREIEGRVNVTVGGS